jgi:hypothetical protein
MDPILTEFKTQLDWSEEILTSERAIIDRAIKQAVNFM